MKLFRAFYAAVLLAASLLCSLETLSQTKPVPPAQLIEQYKSADPATLSPAALYQLAAAHEELQQYSESLSLFDLYYQREPAQTYTLNDMARVAIKSGRTNEAVSYLEKAVTVEPDDFYLRYKLAEAYHTAGDYPNGSDACNDLLDRGYNTPDVWTLMGQCTQAMGLTQFALSHYEEAWRQNPFNRSSALKYLNLMMAQRGIDDGYIFQGLAMCDSVLIYNANDPDITLAKGLLLYRSTGYEGADRIFDQLLEQGDSLPAIVRYGGMTRVHIGRNLDAIPLLEMAYERDSTDFLVVMAMANARSSISHYKEANHLLDAADELLRFEDRHYMIELTRGNMYSKKKDPENAIIHYYKAYLLNTNSTDVLKSMQSVYPYRSDAPEASRQKALFILYTLISKHFELDEPMQMGRYYARILEQIIEDAFFYSQENLALRTPDNKTSTVSVEALRNMRDKLTGGQPSNIIIL